MTRERFAFLLGAVMAAGCRAPDARGASGARVAAPARSPDTGLESAAWLSGLDRADPLVGSVWQPSAQRLVTPEAVLAAAATADLVLLGEQHDNPDHHRLQALVLERMVRAGRKPTVLLEMLEPDDDAIVQRYRADARAPASDLGAALAWEKSGWPPWPFYEPIAKMAFDAGLPLWSANLPRATVRAIVHRGMAALVPEDVTRLGLDRSLAAPDEASLEGELRASHCGQLPEAMVVPMALAQRARDGQMASRMLTATTPVVLIAGAGHVRADRGVASLVHFASPGARVLSVAFVEVDFTAHAPADYAARFHATALPFDFVWFTPRASDADPCKDFAAPKSP